MCVSFFFLTYVLAYFVAVAKSLRGSSEGKALAQAEAAEWKRRYELERCKNLELLLKGFLNSLLNDLVYPIPSEVLAVLV